MFSVIAIGFFVVLSMFDGNSSHSYIDIRNFIWNLE